jgi:hypothetical protein
MLNRRCCHPDARRDLWGDNLSRGQSACKIANLGILHFIQDENEGG